MQHGLKAFDMHFYRHHIGDYRKDTGHLSPLEHGVYRQMIDQYYLEEKPLPIEIVKVYRIAGARTEEEKNAVDVVLDEFFYKSESGFIHKRCDEELKRIYDKSEKAANAASMRWQYGRNANASENDANALKNDASEMLPSNPVTHNPVTQQCISEIRNDAVGWLMANGAKESDAVKTVNNIADEFSERWVDEALTACRMTKNKVDRPVAYFKRIALDKYSEYRRSIGVSL